MFIDMVIIIFKYLTHPKDDCTNKIDVINMLQTTTHCKYKEKCVAAIKHNHNVHYSNI